MRLLPSDPDVETIVGRIKNEDIDLQPDFQRGEVWSQPKQRRLIDSILRDWHVPPIHVVQHPDTKKQDVLDGQQRLAAIRDFVNGKITVDGKIAPIDQEILKLDGMRYAELPPNWKRQFDQFTIRFFRIVDFQPDEPAELFFRLNQPVSLTSAEQRNAFFGPVRSQVKDLVDDLEDLSFGFSNSRMALDDVVARVCLSVENKSITEKITASKLTDRYRSQFPFPEPTMTVCENAVAFFAKSSNDWPQKIKLNKATLFSWLWLSACAGQHFHDSTSQLISTAIAKLEELRSQKMEAVPESLPFSKDIVIQREYLVHLLRLFFDRSSSRVSDVTSVVARDVVMWIYIANAAFELQIVPSEEVPYLKTLNDYLTAHLHNQWMPSELIHELIEKDAWGSLR